jgi:hypothetical protein
MNGQHHANNYFISFFFWKKKKKKKKKGFCRMVEQTKEWFSDLKNLKKKKKKVVLDGGGDWWFLKHHPLCQNHTLSLFPVHLRIGRRACKILLFKKNIHIYCFS